MILHSLRWVNLLTIDLITVALKHYDNDFQNFNNFEWKLLFLLLLLWSTEGLRNTVYEYHSFGKYEELIVGKSSLPTDDGRQN